jgi:hypothetical protein
MLIEPKRASYQGSPGRSRISPALFVSCETACTCAVLTLLYRADAGQARWQNPESADFVFPLLRQTALTQTLTVYNITLNCVPDIISV